MLWISKRQLPGHSSQMQVFSFGVMTIPSSTIVNPLFDWYAQGPMPDAMSFENSTPTPARWVFCAFWFKVLSVGQTDHP